MIAIVGAGISGLALAHDLSLRGVPFIVLESAAAPGGVIRTARIDGHLLEWGPQRTRLVGAVRTLIDQLALADQVILAPEDLPLLIYRRGALCEVPRSLSEFARSDLLSAAGRMRVLAEPLTRGVIDDETVASYFIRKLGYEAYATLVGPLYGGLYASDPADMLVSLSLANTLHDMGIERSLIGRAVRGGGRLQVPVACSFRDGMQALTDALYERHRDHVRLDVSVDRIAGAPRAFDLHTSAGVVQAEEIVLTSSAHDVSQMLRDYAPDAARALRSLHYNPLAIVHLHTDKGVQRGLGYQVSLDETMYTRGVTFNDALFQRKGVYTSYLGGAQHPDAVSWPDEKLGSVAATEFEQVTGASARVVSVARAQMPAWDRSWVALSSLRPIDGIHFCANWESRPGLPGRLARVQRLGGALAG